MIVGATLSLVVAGLTPGFLHPDEHFQILEFANFLLGGTPASDLAWEFRAQIRPFLQPTLVAGILGGLRAIGLDDPYLGATAVRLAHAALGVAGAWALARQYPRWIFTQVGLHFAWGATALLYFLPLVRARTSSESAASAAMLFMFAGLAHLVPTDREPRPKARLGSVFLAAFAGGLAFQLRYQLALMLVGVGAWLLYQRLPLQVYLRSALGLFAANALGVLADRLGYGLWVLPPYRYFSVNLLEGKAAEFGTRPTDAYIGLLWHDLGKPFGALVLLVLVGLLLYRPKDLLVWAVLPFVGLHAVIAHKETRFLSPLYFLVPLAAGVLFEALARRWPAPTPRRVLVGLLLGLNLYYLSHARGFFHYGGGLRQALGAAPEGPLYYVGEHPYGGEQPRMSLYWPRDLTVLPLEPGQIEGRLEVEPAFLYAYHGRHRPPPPLPKGCEALYQEPWLFPKAWYERPLLRRLFDVRDFRWLYRCRAETAFARGP